MTFFNKELLNVLITRKGFRIKDLCKAMKVPYRSLYNWQFGYSKPQINYLKRLAEYFEVDINEFIKSSNTPEFNEHLVAEYTKKYFGDKL